MTELPTSRKPAEQTALLKDNYTIDELLEIMSFLRSEQGCPWDREQTHQSLRENMIEEAYETVDAIDSGSPERLCDELGDVLMQVVFHAQMASEQNRFNFSDVVAAICRKLITRHTHLFGSDQASTAEAVIDNWEKNKKREKGHKNQTQVLQDVPKTLPALQRSYKIQQKAAHVGFDWSDVSGPKQKILEELKEIEAAIQQTDKRPNDSLESEVGDLLFSVVNYARHLRIQPELALNRSTEKFISRFAAMEKMTSAKGGLENMTLDQMDALWNAVKQEESGE
ncbi:MAG: nucleoside triphosphate pyrophosphohydrolase [Eubacteriales bacterium]|nr:nucleoside triphosphate pyrophosphohydrolase [Eubacteriales bacterium]